MRIRRVREKLIEVIKKDFARMVDENGIASDEVTITAVPLSPEQAIGNPEDKDYPLITGKECLMQVQFRGYKGQAFTDMYGNYRSKLGDIVAMDLTNNFRRAIFIACLNAVMRYLGLITKTIHCKDESPKECSRELAKYIEKDYGHPKIAFVGFQPRMIEVLSKQFELKVTDMDRDNCGKEKFGVIIQSEDMTANHLEWCDIVLVTGTTVVNDTIGQFMIDKPVIFYGITISGAAKLLGLNHFCYCGE